MLRIILIVLGVIVLLWLLSVSVISCQTNRAVSDLQIMSLKTPAPASQQVQKQLNDLKTQIDSLSIEIDQAKQRGQTTEVQVDISGNWTPSEKRQLIQALRQALESP